jgi:hypothetical protein
MAAYRRVTVPQFLVAVGYVLLAWATVLFCAAPANSRSMPSSFVTSGWSWPSTDHHFRGYPVPWLEHKQDRVDCVWPIGWRPDPAAPRGPVWLGERRFVGMNPAVPAAMLVLALSVPPLLAAEVRRWWGRLSGQRPPLSRAVRCLRVVVAAAVGGLAVALGDVLTDQVDNGGVKEIPYEHVPVSWLWSWQPVNFGGSLGQEQILRDHLRLIYWLRDKRAERFPVSLYDLDKPEVRSGRWATRTERALIGTAFGTFLGCLIFRPWRRATSPATVSGAAVTTPPVA